MPKTKDKQTPGMKTNGLNDTPQTADLVAAPSNIASTDVFTSYIFSTSSRSLSKYGERLLMEVISVAQEYTIDAALGIHKLNFGEKYSEKFAVIDIPVKNLLNEDDTTNYTKAKEAAVELMKIYHTVEAPVLDSDGNQKSYKDGAPQYKFATFHLLDRVVINEKPGIVSVKLGEETWSQILDMGKGYTRYNLLTAKKLDNVVAIRLFQLLSNSSEPLHFSIERIKGILGLQDKYVNNTKGFITRVIEPAEAEIKEKCPFEVVHEFEYDKVQKKGRPGINGIIFKKVMKPSFIKDPTSVLEPKLLNILVKTFGFDDRGIRSNVKLFLLARESGVNLYDFLDNIKEKAMQANIPQAYVIRSLQNLIGNAKAPFVFTTGADLKSSILKNGVMPASSKPLQKKSSSEGSRLDVNGADAFGGSGLEEF